MTQKYASICAAALFAAFSSPAAKDGGRIVAVGTPSEIKSCPQSVTGRYI